MLYDFKYSLKVLFRNKGLLFWTFVFPIVLGTFFNMAFSNIENSERFNAFDIAIVNDENFNLTYKNIFDSLSDVNNEDRLFNVNYVSLEEAKNLLKENVSDDIIYITGNTVIDALKTTVRDDYKFKDECLNNLDFDNKRVIIVTAHRRENLGKPLENICNALKQIVTEYEDVELVYPVHLNPAVRETAFGILGDMDRVHLIDPLDVEELHNAMSRSFMVMTDSGGIQEEAPALAKPVLVLRKETERPEAVAAGTVKIAGVEKDDIVRLAKELLDSEDAYNKMAHAANPYGDGEASRRTVEAILYAFGYSDKRPENFSVKYI